MIYPHFFILLEMVASIILPTFTWIFAYEKQLPGIKAEVGKPGVGLRLGTLLYQVTMVTSLGALVAAVYLLIKNI